MLSRAGQLPARFDDLLDLDAVDELLSRRGLRTPFLRMAKDGKVIATSRFTRGGGAGAEIGDQVADDAVAALLADGATAVLQGLHRVWPPVMDFAGDLSTDLGHPVQVNAYVTPPTSRGFAAHYDVHDVFVLQLAGTKRWLIHEPVLHAPLRSQPWEERRAEVVQAAQGEPLIDAVLEPGDALYLPRGFLHAAEALGEVSAHLTVGVHPVTRYAVVEALLAAAADDPALRSSLPLGLDLSDGKALEAEVEATVRALVAHLPTADGHDIAHRVRKRSWPATRPGPVAPLRQAEAAATADASTLIRLRPHLRCTVHAEDDALVVELAHRRIELPAGASQALEALLAGEPLTVGELPGLGPDDAVRLARQLLRECVVVPVAP